MNIALLCEPHSQGRPRFARIGGFPRAYDPPASRKWKESVKKALLAMLVKLGLEAPLFTEPVKVDVVTVFGLPKSHHRKRDPIQVQWHEKKPDFDNVSKAVTDAATGVLYDDDCRIVDYSVKKIIAPQGIEPFVGISIAPPGNVSDYWEAALKAKDKANQLEV